MAAKQLQIDQLRKLIHPSPELKHYVCPVFRFDSKERPFVIGSAVLLAIAQFKFLLSAAHVFDQHTEDSLYSANKATLFEITGRALTSLPLGETIDRADVAIMELDAETSAQFTNNSFLKLSQTCVHDLPGRRKFYAFVGYPSSKGRPNPVQKMARTRAYSYSTVIADDSVYKDLGLRKHFHIVVKFDQSASTSVGTRVRFPTPYGMSGCGIWLVRDLSSGRITDEPEHLVGIGIEYHKSHGVLVGTAISVFLEAIRFAYPALSSHIPKSTNRRVNINPDG